MSLAAKQSPRVEARWRFILAQACSRASVRGQGRGLRVKERCAQRPVYTTFYACAMACARTSRIKRFSPRPLNSCKDRRVRGDNWDPWFHETPQNFEVLSYPRVGSGGTTRARRSARLSVRPYRPRGASSVVARTRSQ